MVSKNSTLRASRSGIGRRFNIEERVFKERIKEALGITKGCIVIKNVAGIDYVYNVWKETITMSNGERKPKQHWKCYGPLRLVRFRMRMKNARLRDEI